MFKPAETLRNALICSVWLCWGLTFDTSTCAQEQTLGMFTVRHMHSHTSIDHVSALNVPDWDLIIVDMPQIALQGYIHRNVTKGWTDQRHTAELEPSLLEITGIAKYVLCLAVPVVVLLSPTKWACQCHVTVASWKKKLRGNVWRLSWMSKSVLNQKIPWPKHCHTVRCYDRRCSPGQEPASDPWQFVRTESVSSPPSQRRLF